jgi:3-hydroxyisobutyrate dehydrogenase
MAANLLKARLPVTVFDVRKEAIEGLEALGAVSASSPAEVASMSDMVGISVVDDAQVLKVVDDEAGILAGIRPGSIVLIHSTVHPETCRQVERRCRDQQVDCLDVMVSGFPEKAASGDLTLMIGGDEAVASRCGRYLDAIGTHRFHAGPIGAGAVAKIANNVMWKLAMVGAYEGLNVARAGGIDAATMADIALASSGRSEALRRWRDLGIHEDTPAGLWERGISLGGDRILAEALAIAGAEQIDLPVISAILGLAQAISRE